MSEVAIREKYLSKTGQRRSRTFHGTGTELESPASFYHTNIGEVTRRLELLLPALHSDTEQGVVS